MKRVWFAAAAVAALSLSAFGAQAHEQHACIDDACTLQSLLPAAPEGAAGEGVAGDATALASPKYGAWGFDLSGMDTSVRPGDDFYKFASGNWDAKTQIPSDRTRYGNFDKLSELSELRTQAIIEAAANNKAATGDTAKVGAAYRAFMNEAQIEALDAKPIAPWLDGVKKVKTKDEFTALMGKSTVTPYASLISVGISTDAKNPKAYAVYSSTGGISLPDRDYYLQPSFADKKQAYETYVAALLAKIGWDNPPRPPRPWSPSRPPSPRCPGPAELRAALEARRRAGRGRARRGGRQGLRRPALPAGVQGADGRAGRQPARGVPRSIEALDWMSDETKAKALAKLGKPSPRRSATRTSGATTRPDHRP
jgi:hypothetical protein